MTAVQVQFTVPADVRQEGAYFVAGCAPLDIFSRGETEEAALTNLAEALRIFFKSCCERGTLDDALDGGDRERLHRLLDALPDHLLDAAGRGLVGLSNSLADPVTSALAKAPMDDEPVTPADVEAIKEGERDVEEGRVVSAAELRRRLGAADALSSLQREAEQRGLDRLALDEVNGEIQTVRTAPTREV